MPPATALFSRRKPVASRRGIHFDLKGTPPTPRRQMELLELAGAARLNFALLEWEDTYCWSAFPELRNETAFSEKHVRAFLRRAADLKISIIPLVQCFGHMENVLSRPRFRRFREISDNPADLCPLKPGGRNVVIRMIDDILRTHGGRITHFHLGGDEAGTIGSCPDCRKYVRRHGKAALYLQHVEPILDHLNQKGIRPILWDDMMREWDSGDLRRIAAQADLMVWSYEREPFHLVKREMLDRYARAGVRIWAGACFKGDKLAADLPDFQARSENLLSWAREARSRPMEGIIATGWGRFATLMVPSETIETALDLLLLAGMVFWDGVLPDDPAAAARAHLRGAGLPAGRKFDRCLKAATALRDWRQSVTHSLDWADAFAQFSGEPDRVSERNLSRKGFDDLLAQGGRVGEKFLAAHRGLVPDVWLERYVLSRILPLRRRIDAIHPQAPSP